MKKILIVLLGLLLLPVHFAHADYKQDECVLIRVDDIIKGKCKTDASYSGNEGIDIDINFQNENFHAMFFKCIDKPKPSCQKGYLDSDKDPARGSDAIEQFRDDQLRITTSPNAKFRCLKRIKSPKNPYELCILNNPQLNYLASIPYCVH